MSERERQILECFRQLSSEEKQAFSELAKAMSEAKRKEAEG